MKRVTLKDIRNSWRDIITRLEQSNSKIAHFLEDARLHSFDGKQVLVELVNGHRFHLKTLEKDAKLVEEEMYDILGKSIKIKFILQDDLDKLKERITKLNDKRCREIAVRLLKMYQRYSIGIAKIEETGLELPESIKEDFYDVVLDLLGVPEDNHSDTINVQGFSGYETINYCREWLWLDVDMDADTEEIVKWIEGQVKLYHDEHGKLSEY